MKKALLLLISLFAFPNIAFASDFTGLLSTLAFLCVILPIALIHLLLLWIFSRKGKYVSKRFAQSHTTIALITPVLGVFVVAFDFTSGGRSRYEGMFVGWLFMAAVMFFACLPLWAHVRQQARKPNQPHANTQTGINTKRRFK
jgi:hypothetical protein